jgi:UDP-N-acetyl-D-mannosaminuronate dehydrogenase
MNKNNVKITVVGLGYVGLPLTIEFSKHFSVIGFDLNIDRIKELKLGYDKTKELSKEQLLNNSNLTLVSDINEIKESNIYIITVPTPVNRNNIPNLNPLKTASEMVGAILKANRS